MAYTLPSSSVTLTIATAIVRAGSALTRVPEIRLRTSALSSLRHTNSMTITSVATDIWVSHAITIGAFECFTGAIDLNMIRWHTPVRFFACTDATDLVDGAMAAALIIDDTITH